MFNHEKTAGATAVRGNPSVLSVSRPQAATTTGSAMPHARRAVMVRRTDDLGRVSIPIEMRRTLGIGEHAAVTIEAVEGGIILRPWEAACALCGQAPAEGVFEVRDLSYLCRDCASLGAHLHAELEAGE